MDFHRSLVLVCVLVLTACEGPTGFFSGGELAGPVQPVPESFEFARDAGTVQLETRPGEPYSVNIACAVVGDGLYISAGDNRSQWVENMEADPRVRMRIKGDIYELQAVRVTEAAEMDAFAEEWLKNSWARDPRGYDEVFVYRLTAR
jgi:hypothetical protein